MNWLNLISNQYEREARLFPALILVAPVLFSGAALLRGKLWGLQTFITIAVVCGGAFLLTQLARDAGKNGEKKLQALWGGLPSISILRHRDTRLDATTKKRYHAKLQKIVKGTKAPTAKSEREKPEAADQTYAAWSNFLRVNMRDTKKYNLLFKENVNYGFRRNIWGLKNLGITICLTSCVVVALRFLWLYRVSAPIDSGVWVGFTFSFSLLLLWIFQFSPNWVRTPADAYAERLVEGIEVLDVKK